MQNDNLSQTIKQLYDYWFTQFDFPNEIGKPYHSSGGKMEFNAIVNKYIPSGWKICNLSDVGAIISGGTPSTTNPNFYCLSGYAWITPNDLSNNKGNMYISHGERDITLDAIKNSSAQLIPTNSILLSTRAPIGYIAISNNDVTTNQGFKSIVLKAPCYLYYIFYTIKRDLPLIEALGTGTTFKEVSKESIAHFNIIMPPDEILMLFNNRVSKLATLIKNNEHENVMLLKYRDWLLPMLMNGQATIED
jgi:type I restriction enzyme S subunit